MPVRTLMRPVSLMKSRGVVTWMRPAPASLRVVLRMPLTSSPFTPEMKTDSRAVTVTLPAGPSVMDDPSLLTLIWPPFRNVSRSAETVTLPAGPLV